MNKFERIVEKIFFYTGIITISGLVVLYLVLGLMM